MKLNKNYLTLCKAVKYRNHWAMNVFFRKMQPVLFVMTEHLNWFMKFCDKNHVRMRCKND